MFEKVALSDDIDPLYSKPKYHHAAHLPVPSGSSVDASLLDALEGPRIRAQPAGPRETGRFRTTWENKTQAEVARSLGVHETTVSWALDHALALEREVPARTRKQSPHDT